MKCKKCGTENKNYARFCRTCGASLKTSIIQKNEKREYNKIILITIIAILIILLTGVLYSGGIIKNDIPLEKEDFEIFKMDVPKGSDFIPTNSIPFYTTNDALLTLSNEGEYSNEIYSLLVSPINKTHHEGFKLVRTDGDINVFIDTEDDEEYYIEKEVDGYAFSLIGSNEQTMIKMLNSIELTN